MFSCEQHIQQAVRITETDPKPHTHMNPGDTVQIEAPDFNPDIDRVSSPTADEKPNDFTTHGTSSPTPAITEPEGDSPTPVTTIQQFTSQEMDWLDTIPVQIPWVLSLTVQPNE